MGFLALLAVAAIGWAVWSGKLQQKQLPPVLLGLAGAFIAARGSLLIGVAALVGAVFYALLAEFTDWPSGVEQVLTVTLVFALRMLAAWRGWRTQASIDISERLWEKLGGSEAEAE